MTTNLVETTIRNFGGGWNVSDSDKSLTSKYQVVSDNIVRQTDGSFAIRPGTRLFADMKQGTETVVTGSFNVQTYAALGDVQITKTAHGYVNGAHINITSWGATIGTITSADILGNHGIRVVDANTFRIYVRKAGVTASGPTAISMTYTYDTHQLGGRDIFARYYKDKLIVFTDTGEIVAVDLNGGVTQIWNYSIATGLTIQPWGPCKRISAEIVRGHLLAVNGALNDKPLDINGTVVNYLVDPSGTPSNAAVPRADFVIAADRYVLLVSTEYGATKVEISAKNTTGVFSRNPSPADAVEIDLGMLTQAIDTTILGANVFRSRVFIGFHDRSQLGTLGIYVTQGTSQVHEPDFKDNVAQLGTFSHASIISLGSDLLCSALNGVNSLEISRSSGEYTPQTVSDYIHPVMLRHFTRLSEDDRRYRCFAVWDVNYRSYMVFAPKYSDITYSLPQDPVVVSESLQASNLVFVLAPSHVVDAGDYIDIAGVTNSPDATVPASIINGRRRIRAIYDDDTLVVECDPYPVGKNFGFGGTAATFKPVNDETPAYVYEYNSRLKIARWSRFRGMNFDYGCISQLNKLYLGQNGRIYRFGNNTDKYTADKIGDYTKRVWANSTAYAQGDRVLDSTVKQVYICMVAHTSPSSGTFKTYRDTPANHGVWEEFEGIPIDWEMETAWTDFKERKLNKQIEVVGFDTEGSSDFEFSIYTDTIRTDFESFQLIPNRTTIFVGQDAPGFGAGMEPFGGGRNTRQEWLRGMPVYGKLFRLRFAGSSTKPLQVNAATMYYHKSRSLT